MADPNGRIMMATTTGSTSVVSKQTGYSRRRCMFCSRPFKTEQQRRRHLASAHDWLPDFECADCTDGTDTFTLKENLFAHFQEMHRSVDRLTARLHESPNIMDSLVAAPSTAEDVLIPQAKTVPTRRTPRMRRTLRSDIERGELVDSYIENFLGLAVPDPNERPRSFLSTPSMSPLPIGSATKSVKRRCASGAGRFMAARCRVSEERSDSNASDATDSSFQQSFRDSTARLSLERTKLTNAADKKKTSKLEFWCQYCPVKFDNASVVYLHVRLFHEAPEALKPANLDSYLVQFEHPVDMKPTADTLHESSVRNSSQENSPPKVRNVYTKSVKRRLPHRVFRCRRCLNLINWNINGSIHKRCFANGE